MQIIRNIKSCNAGLEVNVMSATSKNNSKNQANKGSIKLPVKYDNNMTKAERRLLDQDFYGKVAVFAASFIALFFIAHKLFGEEMSEVINWWLVLLCSGMAFMPLSLILFRRFRDSGWLFSKVLGIAVSGWFIWFLSSIKLFKFTEAGCWFSLVFCFVANCFIYILYIRNHKADFDLFERPRDVITHALLAEMLFFIAFIIWNYIKGFKPEAYGTTEKMMDYGFMKAMFKSDYMPPEDMWMAGEPINYYYVGQFMTTYITKLAGSTVEYGYNLSLTMLSAFGFSLPCSIVFNAAYNVKEEKTKFLDGVFPYFAGGLAGLAVSIAGNMHYCVFNNLAPILRNLLGVDKLAEDADYVFDNYWFPNATRYIGYNPDTADKTIHEFPSYSFVLGDLHAHVINIMFVLTVTAILLGLLLIKKKELKDAMTGTYLKNDSQKGICGFAFKDIFAPSIVVIGFFIGLFHTTNYWDYPIYFVVSGAVILFMNCRLYNFSLKTLLLTLFHAVVVIVTAKLTALPFTVHFHQIASQLNICQNHTPLYQMIILWALPVTVTLVFLGTKIAERKNDTPKEERNDNDPGRKNPLFRFIANLSISDMFILTLGLCAIGLVILPEVVYVKDIYSGDYKRANTMFKLTYQAFILFGMTMGYVISKYIFYAKKTSQRAFGVIMFLLLYSTFGYFDNATKAWFGNYDFINGLEESQVTLSFVLDIIYYAIAFLVVFNLLLLFIRKKKSIYDIVVPAVLYIFAAIIVMELFGKLFKIPENYEGLNSGIYLQDENMDDFLATNYINEHIEGRPVLLEANGLSYKYYNRVSVITGLPTILGWRTHEWLWHSDSDNGNIPDIVEERERDVESIYTSEDIDEVKELLDKYNVEYIYIGGCEREKFGGNINYDNLLELCDVWYPEDYVSPRKTITCILKVKR